MLRTLRHQGKAPLHAQQRLSAPGYDVVDVAVDFRQVHRVPTPELAAAGDEVVVRIDGME